jgi:uncharacterized membrane protein YphA (DoxX/SURF4 family)
VLIRLMVAAVFLSEGASKFLFLDERSLGRLVRICARALIPGGLLTWLTAIPLIADTLVAVAATNIPILLERGFGEISHESRTGFSMLFGTVFLLISWSGAWSADYALSSRQWCV